jgi:GNAT superfamily N-acetyltransferase
VIRVARAEDVPAVVGLVHELAEYERSPELCTLTEEQLHAALFGPEAVAGCHVAEVAGEVVGCAIWFRNFSTWRGVPGIYLEDLFVRPSHRGTGLGFYRALGAVPMDEWTTYRLDGEALAAFAKSAESAES